MAQAESQPAPGQPDGGRRPSRPRRPERHDPRDSPCPPGGKDSGVSLEHPVVVGYDGSDSSRHALAYAAGMARRLSRPLLIVHVCPTGMYCEPLTGQVVGLQRNREDLERWLVAEFDQIADRAGLKVCVLTRRGSAARELAATADEHGADALVIGAPTRLWHQVAGSVPGWLARHAHCPVMVVP